MQYIVTSTTSSSYNSTVLSVDQLSGGEPDDISDINCDIGRFCAMVVTFQVNGLSAPLALFLISSLPVGFLLYFLWKANLNYKHAWKKNRQTKSKRYTVMDPEDPSTLSTNKRPNTWWPFASNTAIQKPPIPLLPLYYTFVQFVSLCYSLNFILQGFFSNVRAINLIVLPILFCILEFSQLLVIGFMFIKQMNRTSKILAVIVAAFMSLVDMMIRFVLESQGIPVLSVSCKKDFTIYWMVYRTFFGLIYATILVLRNSRYKHLVRRSVIPYVSVLLIISIIDFSSALLLYTRQDAGLCVWLLGYLIFYGCYAPVLYYTLSRDSIFWHHLANGNASTSSTEKSPLMPTQHLNMGLDAEWIIPWEELTIGVSIGRGGYGEVCIGQWKGITVAVKKLFYKNMNEKDYQEFKKECQILSSLHHPNIVKMLGACIEPPNLVIVTEFMPKGNLQDLLYDQAIPLSWKLKLKIAHDIAKGVGYLHSLKPPLIHRDLKSSNLLVGENYETKVSDFGIAKWKEERTMTMVGTVQWTAPEVLRGKRYNSAIDTYSFAIILWEIAARFQPHANLLSFEVISGVALGGLRPPVPEDCPEEFKELMRQCWDDEPNNRPTFQTISTLLSELVTNAEMTEWE